MASRLQAFPWPRPPRIAIHALAVALCAALACGGAAVAPAASPVEPTGRPALQVPPLVLVSLDGFRADYLERFQAPHLLELARQGVRARGLIPVFPSKTFPVHYTLVTGLYPEHHGVVGNTMYDPRRNAWFRRTDRAAVEDAAWWGGEPLWVTAARQGLTSGVLFWPGSEAPIGGAYPTYLEPYRADWSGARRVDRVLGWLDLPPGERPVFLTLYLGDVDSTGHREGPHSTAVGEAVARIDAHLGRLIAGLAARELQNTVNLIVVSDHGMAATSPERTIVLEEYVNLRGVRIVGASPVLMLHPPAGREEEVYRKLRGAHPHLGVYRRGEVPARLHFREHPRIGPLICIADEGWTIRRRPGGRPPPAGAHGYDPHLVSMHGLFVARGPAFARGAVVPVIESIHLYALMCEVLGIEPAPNDGDAAALRHLLD